MAERILIGFIIFKELQSLNSSFSHRIVTNAQNTSPSGSTVLLYSTNDDLYLPAIIGILERHDASIYIDKKDSGLPKTPSIEKTEILKDTIKKSHKFAVFVTSNSIESCWVPWELDFADRIKNSFRTANFLTAKYSHEVLWA